MKSHYKPYQVIIASLFALSTTTADSLNITKLGLTQLTVHNKTQQPQDLTVTFWEKCEGCPRLHGVNTQQIHIESQKSQTIAKQPHVIKNITLADSSKNLNFSAHKKNTITSASIQSKSEETLAMETDFSHEITNDDDYNLLRSGHQDHVSSLPAGVKHKQFFDKLTKLYDQNNLSKLYNPTVAQKQAKISRIIHQIWFGKHPMPAQFRKWQEEWKAKHPRWIFIEWDEERIKQKFPQGMINQKIYDEARMMYDYATMSKVARYEILNKFGGLYVDPDLKCYETFEPLHHIYDFYAGLGSSNRTFGLINNGIIGARPNHPIIKAAIDYIKQCETKTGGLYDWTAKNLSMKPLTEAVWAKIGSYNHTDIIFPRSFFDCNNVKKEFNHTEPIYETGYVTIKHKPETLCSRGVYSYRQ